MPTVVSEQLGLAKGFGLVVEYVEPNSPAAAAGVQQNDILKMLNDQILIEPSQLRKLLQTFPEGAEVTLTVLRKGQEQKVTAKLTKKEMSAATDCLSWRQTRMALGFRRHRRSRASKCKISRNN